MSPTDETDRALLRIDGLDAGYGEALVLDDLELSMGVEALAVVGRNGMGKTTLCQTILGMVPQRSGSITFDGTDLGPLATEARARTGIGYVPQGRRLFRSLTVDEHLAMLEPGTRGKRWTAEAVYDLFPRLAERKRSGGGDLSGGEQQMLAVGRALLLNSSLLIMDEPSEGLAPTIVDVMIDVVRRLVDEGVAVLVVEQNLQAAAAMADRVSIMVSGRIELETSPDTLTADVDLQRRYLGVGQH
ncbi:MAG: ABC transporter ATP-binding protein [Actinomycetota bacterium]